MKKQSTCVSLQVARIWKFARLLYAFLDLEVCKAFVWFLDLDVCKFCFWIWKFFNLACKEYVRLLTGVAHSLGLHAQGGAGEDARRDSGRADKPGGRGCADGRDGQFK